MSCISRIVNPLHIGLSLKNKRKEKSILKLIFTSNIVNRGISFIQYSFQNNRETGDLRRHRAHNDVTVIEQAKIEISFKTHNHIHHRVWVEITYPFPNFNGATVRCNRWNLGMDKEITYPLPNFNGATIGIWERISNFIRHFTGYVITYPCCQGSKLIHVNKRALYTCMFLSQTSSNMKQRNSSIHERCTSKDRFVM